MIPSSNSSVKRSGTLNHYVGDLLHTMEHFQAVPRANRSFPVARNSILCATSSTNESPAFGPWQLWRSFAPVALPGERTGCAIAHRCAPWLSPWMNTGGVRDSHFWQNRPEVSPHDFCDPLYSWRRAFMGSMLAALRAGIKPARAAAAASTRTAPASVSGS